jgi:hypothetical protein
VLNQLKPNIMRQLLNLSLSALLLGCTLPPIRRVEPDADAATETLDDGATDTAIDGTVIDDGPLIDVPTLDMPTVPDVPDGPDVPSRDAGTLLPMAVVAERVYTQRVGSPLAFTHFVGGSKLVANTTQMVATAWSLPAGGGSATQILFSRLRRGRALWRERSRYDNVPTGSALAMDIGDKLLLALTCNGACGPGATVPVTSSGLLQFALNLGDYMFMAPTDSTFDTAPSAGLVSLAVHRGSSEFYWSHLTRFAGPATGVRRMFRSGSVVPVVLDRSGAGRWPLVAIAETTRANELLYAVSNATSGNAATADLTNVELLRVNGNAVDTVPLTAPPMAANGGTDFPIFFSSLESSPNGTLFAHIHGKFAGGICTYVFRLRAGVAPESTPLGCQSPYAQLHVINDNELLFVDGDLTSASVRVAYSRDSGASWVWRRIVVTALDSLPIGDVLVAPSLVRASTSPNGFESRTVRMVISAGSFVNRVLAFNDLLYIEFSF